MNSSSSNVVRKCPKKSSTQLNIGGSGPKKILMLVLGTLVLLIVVYLLVFTVKYMITDCYSKRSYLDYILGFNFSNVCVSQYPPASYKERKIEDEKEVFHVGHQVLTYKQAGCKCAAYGARLATKNEVIKAYNKGANWCTYGWTEGQNAFFPVQKCYWDDLQEDPDPRKRKSCGHPGINGGFFANPLLKFGANCYGVKPKGSVAIPKKPFCEEKDFCDKKVNESASKEDEQDRIAPFNKTQWSMY